MIRLVVGLGNPGQQYEKTRHNAGFTFLDTVADSYSANWQKSVQFQGEIATIVSAGNKIVLLKPMTYMNRSGASVAAVLRYYKIQPDEMLVAHDELDLPEATIRLKKDGGHAGHNGLRDIIAQTGTKDFFRLRIGIGRPVIPAMAVADYVLSRPTKQTSEQLELMCQSIVSRLGLLLNGDPKALDLA